MPRKCLAKSVSCAHRYVLLSGPCVDEVVCVVEVEGGDPDEDVLSCDISSTEKPLDAAAEPSSPKIYIMKPKTSTLRIRKPATQSGMAASMIETSASVEAFPLFPPS